MVVGLVVAALALRDSDAGAEASTDNRPWWVYTPAGWVPAPKGRGVQMTYQEAAASQFKDELKLGGAALSGGLAGAGFGAGVGGAIGAPFAGVGAPIGSAIGAFVGFLGGGIAAGAAARADESVQHYEEQPDSNPIRVFNGG